MIHCIIHMLRFCSSFVEEKIKMDSAAAPPVPSGAESAVRRKICGKRIVEADVLPNRPKWLATASTTTQTKSAVPAAVAKPAVKFAGAPSRRMPASQIRRGSAMEHLAKDMVKEFKADPRCQSATSSRRTFCYGTMCSGSEITGVGLNMLQCVCASNGIEWEFEQAYACEIESKKRDWILEVTEDKDCCIYEDFIQFHPISIIALIQCFHMDLHQARYFFAFSSSHLNYFVAFSFISSVIVSFVIVIFSHSVSSHLSGSHQALDGPGDLPQAQ